jgi:hypothetical protein
VIHLRAQRVAVTEAKEFLRFGITVGRDGAQEAFADGALPLEDGSLPDRMAEYFLDLIERAAELDRP